MSLLSEFKDFAVKGNVVDMAVGIIVGGAFGKHHRGRGRCGKGGLVPAVLFAHHHRRGAIRAKAGLERVDECCRHLARVDFRDEVGDLGGGVHRLVSRGRPV